MGSALAKVLHPFRGRPLVLYPLEAAARAGARRLCVVIGRDAEAVQSVVMAWSREHASRVEVVFVHQSERRGTGHAVECALPALPDAGVVWILSGDVPLVRTESLQRLREHCEQSSAGLAMTSFRPSHPQGYGRVLRGPQGQIIGIREERDASEVERAIPECNAGTYCVSSSLLREGIPGLGEQNAQGEKYLTDLVAWAAMRGDVLAQEVEPFEAEGVNTPEQLRRLEALDVR